MLFLTYWELNEDMSVASTLAISDLAADSHRLRTRILGLYLRKSALIRGPNDSGQSPVAERQQIAGKLTSSGLFPSKGVNIIRWDSTPDGWGILIAEAETAADISDALNMWRAAGAGFFKFTRTAPAEPVQEVLPRVDGLLKALGSM